MTRTPSAFRIAGIAAAVALLAGMPQPVAAAKAGAAERLPREKACALSAVTWARPERLPPVVRSAPSFHAPIVGRMTHEVVPGEDAPRGVDISVTAIAGEWVRIEPVEGDAERHIAAAPAGWLDLRDVYFVMQTSAGFARPDADSRRVYATDDWIYRASIRAIRDCRDEWLKLQISEDYDEDAEDNRHATFHTAWFRGFCGVAETTCDGVKGD